MRALPPQSLHLRLRTVVGADKRPPTDQGECHQNLDADYEDAGLKAGERYGS
ncbi:MAG: hypothetical protein Nkreftii_003051 [Candidatus Nitrospira kreftii]|uniref:Uncharacterized protein n=1 Tax=Candidatus Nitrospira kreftii TaxID=2652173 RepID=A0A7S8FG87_9BACT|nr:MAG: hypothetical protein Nkreftii_003051 [Candidatus Nitrospira kreftii]